jgi:metal-responsive CopG/Arc/MetJ family transcriptional regulator
MIDKDMRDKIISVQKQYYTSAIGKIVINVEHLMQKGVGVAEHPDLMETIDGELGKIAELHDKIEVLEGYFE